VFFLLTFVFYQKMNISTHQKLMGSVQLHSPQTVLDIQQCIQKGEKEAIHENVLDENILSTV